MLYTISKLRKSKIQCFKRCAIWSSNEEVTAIASRSLQAKGRILQSVAKSAFCCENSAAFLYSVVDSLLKLPDICHKLEAENLKVEANFAALFLASQTFSKDFSSEDESLGFLSLGVRKAGIFWNCQHLVINFVDYSLNQGAPVGHESAETPIGHESNGAVAGDRTPNQMVPLPLPLLGMNQMAPLPGMVPLYNDITFSDCACHIEYEIAEEAMNFMSYVAEVLREWGEPNARDKGRMTSQPKAKVQAISQTSLQAMPCAICLSYEHLVDECPTIPAEREMFGDCNTYNSNWRDYPNFSWKPQPPQYKQPAQAPQQVSILEQAMVNLSKFVGDFIGAQKSINAQINQRIDSVESSLIKRMDEVQNDLSQKLDILQDSISRFANLNTMQEKENSPSQPYQNSKGIHEVESQEGESLMEKEVKTVITLSGKEVDLPTCKLEHKVESETEKEKSEEIKGKKKEKSIEEDDYDFDIDEEPQRIVIKEELMKKHMPPPFLQALYGKIIQTKSQLKDANFIWDPDKLNQEQIF
ncbi:hypothetical protein CK203_102750 [Vitis vinifera]|uniref:Uncharacterized protein n=1 Tax=Vitis vinifera TaxID=29760 RepID=A0A438FF97_VITVI|nr:hypothetical protein CK203_102750 [Vitis vinifera]